MQRSSFVRSRQLCFLTNPLREEEEEPRSFYATVIETEEKRILVEPVSGSDERNSADRIWVSLNGTIPRIVSGDTVRVVYNGQIAESYPAQIHSVSSVYIVNDTKDIDVDDEIRSYYYSGSPDPVHRHFFYQRKTNRSNSLFRL